MTLTDRENDVIYQCHATNDALGQTVDDTVTLTVMCKFCSFTYVPPKTNHKYRVIYYIVSK